MAKYIDAERLKRTFASGIRVYDGMCKIADVMHNIENEPTADVVEVCRCKDCKYYDDKFTNFAEKHKCQYFNSAGLTDNDFCNHGIPREVRASD